MNETEVLPSYKPKIIVKDSKEEIELVEYIDDGADIFISEYSEIYNKIDNKEVEIQLNVDGEEVIWEGWLVPRKIVILDFGDFRTHRKKKIEVFLFSMCPKILIIYKVE